MNQLHYTPFEENSYYHVYCRAVSESVLFREDENRHYFLRQYQKFLNNYVNTYAYTLLDNHAHWLIKTKPYEEVKTALHRIEDNELKTHQKKMINGSLEFGDAVELQFKDFFISYAKAYNKRYNRSGNLFMRPFKRRQVNGDAYFTQVIIYIHANIKRHKISNDFENYPWSSYQDMLGTHGTWLQRNEVLEWFGGRDSFVNLHRNQADYYYNFGKESKNGKET